MEAGGRSSLGRAVSVRLRADTLIEVDRRASAAGVSRSEVIRYLLDREFGIGFDDEVDRAELSRRLAMTPAQRVRTMVEETRRLLALQGKAGL
jgi:hypothetical protein